MKYLKTFESVDQFDLDLAITRVKEEYSDNEVASRYDLEIMEWVDPDWEEDYECEYDWYIDHNNGEAQDVVIGEMIDWYKRTYDKDMSDDDYSELFDEIKSEYGLE
jgi:hypothetical protein